MAKILATKIHTSGSPEATTMKIPKSVTEASLAARISTDVVRRAVDRGELLAVKMTSGERLIDPDDLERWVRERSKRGK
jgi:hypothetical protein